MNPADQAEIRILPGNDKCVDCGGSHPQWASVTFGALMCLECSGAHRGLGTHITFIRSVTMDTWTAPQLKKMKSSSNTELRAWWQRYGIAPTLNHNPKYHAPASALYAQRLTAKVEGKPLPTALPAAVAVPASAYDAPAGSGMSAGGFGGGAHGDTKGAEALSGETEAAYVLRQVRLQEEARARMRAKFGAGGMGAKGSDASYDPNGGGTYGVSSGVGAIASRATGWMQDSGLTAAFADEERAAQLRAQTAEVARNSWNALRGWGAGLADVVKGAAQPEADASDLASALRHRREAGMLGTGKQYAGAGGGADDGVVHHQTPLQRSASNGSGNGSASGLDGLSLDDAPPRPPLSSRSSISLDASPRPPRAPPQATPPSGVKAKKMPKDEDDFFGDFGV
ncbi:hypothetical protein M885DRAFT_548239 [Pelagophyceae sp. CCMP2097]|nr:hypothetical protein M885DRAFT_548239 [Pelagophyceae sp. CCMP2097]